MVVVRTSLLRSFWLALNVQPLIWKQPMQPEGMKAAVMTTKKALLKTASASVVVMMMRITRRKSSAAKMKITIQRTPRRMIKNAH